MKIALFQGHFPVGAVSENAEKIIQVAQKALHVGAEVVVFPELALSGYCPQDRLFQASFLSEVVQAIQNLIQACPPEILVIFGAPLQQAGLLYNGLLAVAKGRIQYQYYKQALPNQGVFDEKRYFEPGTQPGFFVWQGYRLGFLICEDLWQKEPILQFKAQNLLPLDCLISIHASPFEQGKREQRLDLVKQAAHDLKAPLLYVQSLGFEDELIYDGGSLFVDSAGCVAMLPQFEECFACIPSFTADAPFLCESDCLRAETVQSRTQGAESENVLQACDPYHTPVFWKNGYALSPLAETYQALCFALKAYVDQQHFPGVILGLSGGIDSALTLAIAVDALGRDRVEAVMMPSRYTADLSQTDASTEAMHLGVQYEVISIETLFSTFLQEVSPFFSTSTWGVTEENIQARLRGMILMALSNKSGKLVVTTTNKSELAVGYGTLYGDMAGGFALLKDVYKTEVYALAAYRNTLSAVIPESVMMRPPSAELREAQIDQDSLPDYPALDSFLKRYLGETVKASSLSTVEQAKVLALIQRNEYKRVQAPLGPKITQCSFGRDWRMPVMWGGK